MCLLSIFQCAELSKIVKIYKVLKVNFISISFFCVWKIEPQKRWRFLNQASNYLISENDFFVCWKVLFQNSFENQIFWCPRIFKFNWFKNWKSQASQCSVVWIPYFGTIRKLTSPLSFQFINQEEVVMCYIALDWSDLDRVMCG